MHQTLYREFRPHRFEEMKGQEHIVAVLQNQVRQQMPAHAYLFSGPRGTGKTSAARILAMALECQHPENGEPCLSCKHCQEALQDGMVDIIEIDAASNNGVDHAREIRDKINLLPAKGKYKIYIIDEVHMLSKAAFNALLKTLEEPPSYGIFILATTELAALPKTVLSRCQRFDFKPIEMEKMVDRMAEILEDLQKPYEKAALEAIADAAEGGLRDALTILDQCVAMAETIDQALVCSVLHLADGQGIAQLLSALSQGNGKQVFFLLNGFFDQGIAPETVLQQLLECLEKDLLGRVAAAEPLFPNMDNRELVHAMEMLNRAGGELRFAPKPKIVLEAVLMRLLLPEVETGEDALLLRLRKLEKGRRATIETAEKASPEKKQRPKQKKETIEMPDHQWFSALIDGAKENFSWRPFLDGVRLKTVEGSKMILEGDDQARMKMLQKSPMLFEMQEFLTQLVGKPVSIAIALAEREETIEPEMDIDMIDE